VLLVEDDDDTRSMYATAIAFGGFTVREAADGRQALSMALERAPDVLVTDLAGPKLDGFELIRWLRANRPTARIPVVVLTGHSDDSARRRATELDAAFVLKPCLPDALIAHIARALGNAGWTKLRTEHIDARSAEWACAKNVDLPRKRG
jgi:two-component system response regulator CpxR